MAARSGTIAMLAGSAATPVDTWFDLSAIGSRVRKVVEMNNLIEQVKHDAFDHSVSVVALLQKALVLAHDLNDRKAGAWVKMELNGYKGPDAESTYRNLKGNYGVLTPDRGILPIVWDNNEGMKSRFITVPIAEIESLFAGDSDSFAVAINVDPRSLTSLDLDAADTVVFRVSRSTVASFLQAVRQRILEWTLSLPSNEQHGAERATGSQPDTSMRLTRSAETVFYSWQSDTPNATNRAFIENCLEKAIGELMANNELSIDPSLDRDTLGVGGTPDIAQTILDKIDVCGLFVCDVTIINKDRDGRRTSNPNVMLELGYAIKTLGWERVICVMNKAYGSVEQLPFHIRSRRVHCYTLEEGKDKTESRNTLTGMLRNDLETAFSLMRTGSQKDEVTSAKPLPKIDILDALVECQPPVVKPIHDHIHHIKTQHETNSLVWGLTATLFFDARPNETITIPLHRSKAWTTDRYSGTQIELRDLNFQSDSNSQVRVDNAVILISGPGKLEIRGAWTTPFRSSGYPESIVVDIELPTSERPIKVAVKLQETRPGDSWPIRWKYRQE